MYKFFLCSVSCALERVQTVSVKTCSSRSCTLEKMERKEVHEVLQQKKEGHINQENNKKWERASFASSWQRKHARNFLICSVNWVMSSGTFTCVCSPPILSEKNSSKSNYLNSAGATNVFFILSLKTKISKKKPDLCDLHWAMLSHSSPYFWLSCASKWFPWGLLSKKVQLRINWGAHR